MTPAETWYAHFRRDRKRKAEVIETIEQVQREVIDEAADLVERCANTMLSALTCDRLLCLAEELRARKP